MRFTTKQTEFLTEQFQKGELSGQKSDPQEVSKAMRLARDQVGQRRFQPDEVLTSQQISGFFSRLSAKKKLEVTAAGKEATEASEVSEVDMKSADEDEISAEAESYLSAAVCANVLTDVAIQHPIVSFDLNICELVPKRKLTTLRVDRLRDMCIDLELDISDISPEKRKKPYIGRLTQLVQECSCSSK